MGVFRATNKSGKVRWGIDYYEDKRKIRKIVGDTRKQAIDAMAKIKTTMFEEKVMGVKRIPKLYFSELREKFLSFSKTNKKPKTYKSHVNSLKALGEAFDRVLLSDITLLMIEEYKAKRLGTYLPLKKRKMTPAAVNRELACLKYMLNLADDWNLLTHNISKKIDLLPEPAGRIRYLETKDEMLKLIECCGPKYLRVIIIIALNTGMRLGEILGLTWKRIDMEHGYIHIDKSKSGDRRDLPINDTLRKTLEEWREEVQDDRLFTVGDIKNSFHNACRKAGIKDFRFHDLRHTFASHLVMNGVDLATVSKLLGHSTIQMTMKYSHLSRDHRLSAVKVVDTFFEK